MVPAGARVPVGEQKNNCSLGLSDWYALKQDENVKDLLALSTRRLSPSPVVKGLNRGACASSQRPSPQLFVSPFSTFTILSDQSIARESPGAFGHLTLTWSPTLGRLPGPTTLHSTRLPQPATGLAHSPEALGAIRCVRKRRESRRSDGEVLLEEAGVLPLRRKAGGRLYRPR